MIHLFLTFGRNAADSPIGQQLSRLGLQHRIISAEVGHHRRGGVWTTALGRYRIAWFAFKAAISSLLLSHPRPRVVVVWTHIEALAVAAVRALGMRPKRTRIVLVGFILTARNATVTSRLRGWYFSTLFAAVDLVVVHSSAEATRYAQIFKGSRSRFVFLPWGAHIGGLDAVVARAGPLGDAQPAGVGADVLCAGRSNRDYPTLCTALAGTAVQVRIVCDLRRALDGCAPASNIRVLRACHGDDYLLELLRARCVVIPLAVDDISAGQMVLLQAMELGKAVVITRTVTTADYATDGHDAVFVNGHDSHALRQAVERLLSDSGERARLGANARRTFSARFTVEAFITRLVQQIQLLDPLAGI